LVHRWKGDRLYPAARQIATVVDEDPAFVALTNGADGRLPTPGMGAAKPTGN